MDTNFKGDWKTRRAGNSERSWQDIVDEANTQGEDTAQVTAFAGGGQGSATQLTAKFTEVSIVATAGDSVKLPSASADQIRAVKNDGIAYMDVFPATGDTIDDGSANAAIRVYPGSTVYFYGINATNWESSQQVGGPLLVSSATGITAFAGGGQGSATQLNAANNEVTVVATAGDSVKLLPAASGLAQIVKNEGVANLAVFPATGDTIDDGSANASILLAPGQIVMFIAVDGTNWETNRTANVPFYPTGVPQNITAGTGGAINVTSYQTTINTDAGGDAFTLANGVILGQLKEIQLITDGGGDGVVTPATAFEGGATTATFNDTLDLLLLQWTGVAWRVLKNFGVTVA